MPRELAAGAGEGELRLIPGVGALVAGAAEAGEEERVVVQRGGPLVFPVGECFGGFGGERELAEPRAFAVDAQPRSGAGGATGEDRLVAGAAGFF